VRKEAFIHVVREKIEGYDLLSGRERGGKIELQRGRSQRGEVQASKGGEREVANTSTC